MRGGVVIHLTDAQRRGLMAHLEQARAEDARDAAAMQADDLEPEAVLPVEVAQMRFEQQLRDLGVSLIWAAWGTR